MYKRVRFFLIKIILVLGVTVLETTAFGQNKVQYINFSWQKVSSKHFNLYFHQDQGKLPEYCYQWIENAYTPLSLSFKFTHKQKTPLIIYGDPNLFTQTNIISEILPEGVGGFTEFFKNRIVVPFNGSYTDLRHVLHHELVHAFCFSILYEQFGSSLLFDSNIQIPLWFMEGLAEYLSSGWDIEADMFLIDQTINSSIPLPGIALDGYMAYKGGQSFLHYLHKSRGDSAFTKFIQEFKHSRTIDGCIKRVYGQTSEELGKEWILELKRIYWPEIGRRDIPTANGTAVTSHVESRSNFNLRPRISPDGTKIAFFSDQKDFSKILITDKKGKIIHEVSQRGYGGYFETFHPFRSGMCWSPDGEKIAFVTKSQSNDEIRIVDIKQKKLVKKITVSLTSISSPDWSSNGKTLVFTGVEKGKSDLYIYNLETSAITRLTDNIQYESDPRFTPDNSTILFAEQDTCGDAVKHTIPYGSTPTDIYKIDINSKVKTQLTSTIWNEKQVCISPDGKKCAFISDRNGIDNIYIGNIDSLDKAKALTDYTSSSSCPDWSNKSDAIVFTLFQNSGWDIWLIDSPESKCQKDTLAYTRWVESSLDSSKRLFNLVPIKKDSANTEKKNLQRDKNVKNRKSDIPHSIAAKNIFENSLKNSAQPDSLKKDTTKQQHDQKISNTNPISTPTLKFPQPQPYKLSFSPDMVSVGLGINTYYGYAGQWILGLSDLMGDHQITLAGDVQGNFKDYIHLFGSYFYLKSRIDVGAGAYFSKDYTYANVFGDYLYKDTDFGGFFQASYPFSLFSRADLQIFARNIHRVPTDTLSKEIRTTTFLQTISYSYDQILWGITGPLNGIRAQVSATVSPPLDISDEHFFSMDADIRSYFHIMRRFVWANRLYLGASVPLNENSSAKKYFLGGNDNWLFYEVDTSNYRKNFSYTYYSDFVTPFRGWNYIQFAGTRVALLNTEFRFPFIREITVVWPLTMQIRYISGALFTDIGNAWDSGEKHNGIPLPDKIYGGIGFGLRANLGMFILRFDRAWPTDWRNTIGNPTNYFSLGAEF
jgi:Tol biopolymer transport system component